MSADYTASQNKCGNWFWLSHLNIVKMGKNIQENCVPLTFTILLYQLQGQIAFGFWCWTYEISCLIWQWQRCTCKMISFMFKCGTCLIFQTTAYASISMLMLVTQEMDFTQHKLCSYWLVLHCLSHGQSATLYFIFNILRLYMSISYQTIRRLF